MEWKDGDSVVMAWAEACSGPGWSNRIVWVLVRERFSSALRLECLQPEQQGAEIVALFKVCAAAAEAMKAAAGRRLMMG